MLEDAGHGGGAGPVPEEWGPELTSCPEGDTTEVVPLLVALEMAAFKTRASVGLMPQARHGGRGVWMLAVVGSKLEGTGLEKLQMVQTQVAEAGA